MAVSEFLRVVALRRGRLNPVEFRLRVGEKGLSLFALVDEPGPSSVVEAVRAAGKQGELAIAAIPGHEMAALGLILVQTTGGTADPAVNAIHYEARLPWLRRTLIGLRGARLHEYFNDKLSRRIWEIARLH